ncbi:MAG: hypothetical protein KKA84_11935 [Bacteroidetes bacterium]|nr:hypothetical protein [Bacteroidota bacterium]
MDKLYIAAFSFISGEYNISFKQTILAKSHLEADDKVVDYLRNLYGPDGLVEEEEHRFLYEGGEIAVEFIYLKETDSQNLANYLLIPNCLPTKEKAA